MIRRHELNSDWFGAPVGIVTDPAFFALGAGEQRDLLADFAWTEFRAAPDTAPHPAAVRAAGFAWVDAQIEFRISLPQVELAPSAAALEVVWADTAGFRATFESCRSFDNERFLALGIEQSRVDERFRAWAHRLVDSQPEWCVEVRGGDRTQGWFLAEPGSTLGLTLAMLHEDSTVSGHLVYQRALAAFAGRGARVGQAGFSVRNTAVHNIYARLGARFVAPMYCWMHFGEHA